MIMIVYLSWEIFQTGILVSIYFTFNFQEILADKENLGVSCSDSYEVSLRTKLVFSSALFLVPCGHVLGHKISIRVFPFY